MIILFILLLFTLLGTLILYKSYDYDIIGLLLCMIFGLYLICHSLFWGLSSYDYEKFNVKRNSFIETLNNARLNKDKFELASITKDISKWNQELESMKYDNTLFLLDDYIDDRIENLKPIK